MRKKIFWSIFITSSLTIAAFLLVCIGVVSSFGSFDESLLIILTAASVLVLIALGVAAILSIKIEKPLRNLNFDNPMSNKTYKELSPMLKSIEEKNAEIADRMEDLTRKRSEFDHITSNMSEGIVVISSEGQILSANKSARQILEIEEGTKYTELRGGRDVISVIGSALSGSKAVENFTRAGRIYRLTATPLRNPYGEYSVVLLILDVTSTEQAESLRREFSANVSHELKTPLTTILGYAEIISSGLAHPEDIPEFAGKIHSEASRLLSLIEDIIKLSRLDEKNLKAQFELVELTELCKETVDRLSKKAKSLGVSLEFEGSPVCVSGYRAILYEIVFNLTDNAITYNKPGGSVKIVVSENASHPKITVIDTGIGIAKEDQSRIFERFYRVDKSHSKETGGTGLGLSIVKHGALLHGAKLSLESELGQGTSVSVRF